MGVYRRGPLPEGGETLFQVVRVGEWLQASYQRTALETLRLVFRDRLDDEDHFGAARFFLDKVHGILESRSFQNARPACLEMGYGDWAERQLRICLYNRLTMLRLHAAWGTAAPLRRVMYVSRLVFETMVRCGLVRGSAYHGLPVPPDEPFVIVDERRREHAIQTQTVPPVHSFGPGPL